MSDGDPKERSGIEIGRGKRIGLMVISLVIAVLGIAWFHGGEQPVRPIVQAIDTPQTVAGVGQ